LICFGFGFCNLKFICDLEVEICNLYDVGLK
jgi:hypothetical protein